ncbi:MAG: hypothetical protein A2Y33_12055 [Spirochaetes bacterium GWF1_51_8]|nr:MAG: hypothetical protein A2Y33_12055 [Spirochaetes bacterium GWF1_51_8]
MPSIFNPKIQEVLDEVMKNVDGASPSKAFGYPSFSIGKKMFACVYEDGVSIKLPRERVLEIMKSDPSAREFRPMNRHTMKEWVYMIRTSPADYRKDLELFRESAVYAGSLKE